MYDLERQNSVRRELKNKNKSLIAEFSIKLMHFPTKVVCAIVHK